MDTKFEAQKIKNKREQIILRSPKGIRHLTRTLSLEETPEMTNEKLVKIKNYLSINNNKIPIGNPVHSPNGHR